MTTLVSHNLFCNRLSSACRKIITLTLLVIQLWCRRLKKKLNSSTNILTSIMTNFTRTRMLEKEMVSYIMSIIMNDLVYHSHCQCGSVGVAHWRTRSLSMLRRLYEHPAYQDGRAGNVNSHDVWWLSWGWGVGSGWEQGIVHSFSEQDNKCIDGSDGVRDDGYWDGQNQL